MNLEVCNLIPDICVWSPQLVPCSCQFDTPTVERLRTLIRPVTDTEEIRAAPTYSVLEPHQHLVKRHEVPNPDIPVSWPTSTSHASTSAAVRKFYTHGQCLLLPVHHLSHEERTF